MIIGLTGGIASGKSEVCRVLKEEGFIVIDADVVAHDVLEIPDVIGEVTSGRRWEKLFLRTRKRWINLNR